VNAVTINGRGNTKKTSIIQVRGWERKVGIRGAQFHISPPRKHQVLGSWVRQIDCGGFYSEVGDGASRKGKSLRKRGEEKKTRPGKPLDA